MPLKPNMMAKMPLKGHQDQMVSQYSFIVSFGNWSNPPLMAIIEELCKGENKPITAFPFVEASSKS